MNGMNQGGLLGGMMSAQAPTGGLLGGTQSHPSGAEPMPPQMMQIVAQMRELDPEEQQQALQQIIQKLQSSNQPPERIQAAIQQLVVALQGQ